MASSDILVAKESFSWENIVFAKGQTRVRADHPAAKANPQYFERVDLSLTYEVEQATARPGEKRGR